VPLGAVAICETCVGDVAHFRVGVSNIFPRVIPPDSGAPPVLSVQLSIWPEDAPPGVDGPNVILPVGGEVDIGQDAYRVESIDAPKDTVGRVVLMKVQK
jgi:hypothetical protein